MKFNLPNIKIPDISLSLPHITLPKFDFRRKSVSSRVDDDSANNIPEDDNTYVEETSDIDETSDADEECEPAAPESKPKSYGIEVSEDQLRVVWAGEIGFSLLIVFAAVLVAIAS